MKPALIRINQLTVNIHPLPTLHGAEWIHGTVESLKPAVRFELSKDGTVVTDYKTGLMWAADELPQCDFAGAEKAVADLRLGGFSDWSLPDLDQLESIRDITCHEPCLDTAFFKSNSNWVRTKTPCAWSPGRVWFVGFGYGLVDLDDRNGRAFVRPVRSVSSPSQ